MSPCRRMNRFMTRFVRDTKNASAVFTITSRPRLSILCSPAAVTTEAYGTPMQINVGDGGKPTDSNYGTHTRARIDRWIIGYVWHLKCKQQRRHWRHRQQLAAESRWCSSSSSNQTRCSLRRRIAKQQTRGLCTHTHEKSSSISCMFHAASAQWWRAVQNRACVCQVQYRPLSSQYIWWKYTLSYSAYFHMLRNARETTRDDVMINIACMLASIIHKLHPIIALIVWRRLRRISEQHTHIHSLTRQTILKTMLVRRT